MREPIRSRPRAERVGHYGPTTTADRLRQALAKCEAIITTCDNAPNGIGPDGRLDVDAIKACDQALVDCRAMATDARRAIEAVDAGSHRQEEGNEV